jgi:hypothetical protein
MARLPPATQVLRALFAKSGNLCAFPGCPHPLVDENNLFVGQVCHIEAAERGGERYNPAQTDEERRGYENLVLLCYRHHVVTNDTRLYTVERLREIKSAHERQYSGKTFAPDDRVISAIAADMERYWAKVGYLHQHAHAGGDFKAPVNVNATFDEVAAAAREALEHLTSIATQLQDDPLHSDALTFLRELGYDTTAIETAESCKNPFIGRNWEVVHLGLRNWLTTLSLLMDQLELLFTSERVKAQPSSAAALKKLEDLKARFLQAATELGLAE